MKDHDWYKILVNILADIWEVELFDYRGRWAYRFTDEEYEQLCQDIDEECARRQRLYEESKK